MKLIRFNGLIFCDKVEDIHMGLFDFFKRNNKVTKDSDFNISNLTCDEITTHRKINENICKCQYKNVQKVENKNVHFPTILPRIVFPKRLAFP